MKTRSEIATEKFLSGYNCAQSVLWSFSKDVRLPPETTLKIACGFGAGIARRQEVCGAVTGGIMVLGLRYGRGERQDRTATEETYAMTQELLRRFEAKHGTCNCRQLLEGCDLATEEGRQPFKERDLLNRTCKACVQTVVTILEDMTKGTPNPKATPPQYRAETSRVKAGRGNMELLIRVRIVTPVDLVRSTARKVKT